MLTSDRHLNLHLLAETLNISFRSVQEIVCNVLQKRMQRLGPEKMKERKKECGSQVHGCFYTTMHLRIIVVQFIAKRGVTILHHPPYKPDLAPADYFLFPKLKVPLKRIWFGSIADIQKDVMAMLTTITLETFSKTFDKLYLRTKACVDSNGSYIENSIWFFFDTLSPQS